jgi:hypothetical protein
MDEEHTGRRLRTFRWPKEARNLVRIHLNAQWAQPAGQDSGSELRVLVTKLVEVSGNQETRFLRLAGIADRLERSSLCSFHRLLCSLTSQGNEVVDLVA